MKIAIYGCADSGMRIVEELKKKEDVEQVLFIDNNVKLIGTKVEDIEVVSLYSFISMYQQNMVTQIIIPSYSISTIRTMKNDLRKNGVRPEDVLIVDTEKFIKKLKTIPKFKMYSYDKLPYLQYVSFEASEICNMNCKRCDHFSNLKDENNCENIAEFEENVKLLASKIESIGTFSFLGGEPLLNDELDKFLFVVKRYFPETQIIILTNGILLKQMTDKLIQAIKDTNTLVKMTLYPPLKGKIDELVDFMRKKEIGFEISKVVDEFWTQINIEGNTNAVKMLNRCVNSDCVLFKRGKLSKCPITMNSEVFNKYFNEKIPQDIIDLKCSSVEDISKYLFNPISTCAYCGYENYFDWEQTKGKVDINEMICLKKV